LANKLNMTMNRMNRILFFIVHQYSDKKRGTELKTLHNLIKHKKDYPPAKRRAILLEK
jgi:hypothetical protein